MFLFQRHGFVFKVILVISESEVGSRHLSVLFILFLWLSLEYLLNLAFIVGIFRIKFSLHTIMWFVDFTRAPKQAKFTYKNSTVCTRIYSERWDIGGWVILVWFDWDWFNSIGFNNENTYCKLYKRNCTDSKMSDGQRERCTIERMN